MTAVNSDEPELAPQRAETGSLFRREALRHRSDRLHGNLSVAVPIGWHLVGAILFASFLGLFAFLSLITHSRLVTARGVLVSSPSVAAADVRPTDSTGHAARPLSAILYVPEGDIPAVTVGQNIQIAVGMDSGRAFGSIDGRITAISERRLPLARHRTRRVAYEVTADLTPSLRTIQDCQLGCHSQQR